MKHPSGWSLGSRLSVWLAIQTFFGLGIVSSVVYLATSTSLTARQIESLAHKQGVVIHLLEEAQNEGDLSNLKHRLDDFLAGHGDLLLALYGRDGAQFYQALQNGPPPKRVLTVRFSLATPDGALGDVTARLSLDTRADDHLLRRLAANLTAAALLGALAVSAGGFLLVRLGLAPVQQLVDQTRGLSADTLGQPLDGSAQPRELQPLVEQFNALLGRLKHGYEQIEGFNADVAHELNTPLSTLITSTELALRRRRDVEALRDVLGSNLEEFNRMSEIVKDMLFLSNADRGMRARRAYVPSLAAIVSDVADYHEAALSDARLHVEIVGDLAGEFDVPLIKRAISNLLGNASRYAERGSTIRIDIATDGAELGRLAVVNRGPAIAAEHLPRLFDRFYRVDPSRTQAESHHGLGLSIVAAIARIHGGSPFAESGDGLTKVGMLLHPHGRAPAGSAAYASALSAAPD